MKPLIGIVGKPYKGERWNYIQQVDEIREVLVKNGANVIGIIPNSKSIEQNYEIYPYYENYDLTDTKDLEKIIDLCDGIVLQGGGVICNYEQFIADYCTKLDKPILGICCGMLNLSIPTGGKVDYCDKEYMQKHHLDLMNMYKHKIKINKNSLLYKIIGKEEIVTNSIHSGKLIEIGEYDIVATSEDGLTEAIEYKDRKFNLGIQWHPELMYKFDKDQEKIFKYFIDTIK